MTIRRFFCKSAAINGNMVLLEQEESNHIKRVLRLETGNLLELCDGSGMLYTGRIAEIGKQVLVQIISQERHEELNRVPLWLGQANLKGKKIDELIPSCNELGVDVFAPLESSRCQGRFGSEKAAKKRERWIRMVESSCKQCKRMVKMEVEPIQEFRSVLDNIGGPDSEELRLIFWEDEKTLTLHEVDFKPDYKKVRILLGPEGGFATDEIDLAKSYGYLSVSLGHRILKAETATLTAVSLVQFLLGNMDIT